MPQDVVRLTLQDTNYNNHAISRKICYPHHLVGLAVPNTLANIDKWNVRTTTPLPQPKVRCTAMAHFHDTTVIAGINTCILLWKCVFIMLDAGINFGGGGAWDYPSPD
jgi:hypothetical protein